MAILKGRRVAGTQLYKIKGRKDYMLVEHDAYCTVTRTVPAIGSLLSDIDTNDPAPIILRLRVNAGSGFLANLDVAPKWLYENCYPISWRKLPDGWKQVFEPDVDQMIAAL